MTALGFWDTISVQKALKFVHSSNLTLLLASRQFVLRATILQMRSDIFSESIEEIIHFAKELLNFNSSEREESLITALSSAREAALDFLHYAIDQFSKLGLADIPNLADAVVDYLRTSAYCDPPSLQLAAWDVLTRRYAFDAQTLSFIAEAMKASRTSESSKAKTAFSRKELLESVNQAVLRSANEVDLVLSATRHDKSLLMLFAAPLLNYFSSANREPPENWTAILLRIQNDRPWLASLLKDCTAKAPQKPKRKGLEESSVTNLSVDVQTRPHAPVSSNLEFLDSQRKLVLAEELGLDCEVPFHALILRS